jgi:hypothetical protein
MSKGSFHVRVKEQPGTRSWLLFIGSELDRGIGSPARVSVIRRGNIVHITPTTDMDGAGTYTVIRPKGGGMARISVGRHICMDELGLFGGINRQCRVENGEIKIFV